MLRYSVPLTIALLCVALAACGPSVEQLAATNVAMTATVVAQRTADAPTLTPTHTPTPRPTATQTPQPSPTSLPTLTPTPTLGAFANPVPIGSTITLFDLPRERMKVSVTLLEIRRGDPANEIAESLAYSGTYEDPIEGQERIALRVKLAVLEAPPHEVFHLYASSHLTLRYEPEGRDIFVERITRKWAEGYPPLEEEGWITFLIREGTDPLLYFQPDLINTPDSHRSQGAFFQVIGDS